MKKLFQCTGWVALETSLIATEDSVYLSRDRRCTRYTIRTVPSKYVDVIVQDDLYDYENPREKVRVEVFKRPYRFGGVRTRIGLTRVRGECVTGLPVVDFFLRTGERNVTVQLHDLDGVVHWEETFRSLPTYLEHSGLIRIFMWHWRRYYSVPISADEAVTLAHMWEEEFRASYDFDRMALNEANRHASRFLYRESRMRGWRKLSPKEKLLHNTQKDWVTVEQLHGIADATGCGEATLRQSWDDETVG